MIEPESPGVHNADLPCLKTGSSPHRHAILSAMRVLSDPTLGLVIEVAAHHFDDSELKTLLMRADLWQHSGVKRKGQELVRDHLVNARDFAEEYSDTENVRQALLTFIRMMVERTVRDPANTWPWFGELREALLADGYELAWELEEADPWSFSGPPNFRIRPTDAGPVPLNTEISALEAELRSRGYDQALNHYRQAIDAFDRHQVRSRQQSASVGLRGPRYSPCRGPRGLSATAAGKHRHGRDSPPDRRPRSRTRRREHAQRSLADDSDQGPTPWAD